MKKNNVIPFVFFLMLQLLTAAPSGSDIANPDFTQGGEPPQNAPHDWNLGPTGLRGWMHTHQLETTSARQVYVSYVAKKSPADKVFKLGDVILGVAGKKFRDDPRVEFGKAITEAEAGIGNLKVIRWREGVEEEVVIQIEPLGAYAATAPYHCEKSRRIIELSSKVLAKNMRRGKKVNPIVASYNALALLATGKKEYRSLVKRHVAQAAKYSDLDRAHLHSWFYGPLTISVAEYTLATGDKRYLKGLERLTREIVEGQSIIGSWGHRFKQQDKGVLAGYGMMHAPGVPLTIALVLARKAGVEVDGLDEAIQKSADLLEFYVDKGSLPYGDHRPWIETHDDNGKNGSAAVLFDLLGNESAARYFSKMSIASYGAEREMGHTGNFFNMLWALPGVARSGPNATGAWLQEFGWYYDLARSWDGSFSFQGPPMARNTVYHEWDCTGVYLLAYAHQEAEIFLTGKQKSNIESIDLKEANGLIKDGSEWGPKNKEEAYKRKSTEMLFEAITSWSPTVRERAAIELGRRENVDVERIVKLLESEVVNCRLGGCQALARVGEGASEAVVQLIELLDDQEMWVRVKAAEALAAIGEQSIPAIPKLLELMVKSADHDDPRNMQQRFVSFALFNPRDGLLKYGMEGVDRELLTQAIIGGLTNEDGRARADIASIYNRLTYEEIKPLLPAIFEAVKKPAPSGIMFADGVRLDGLRLLAKHRIKEGIPWCLKLIGIDRWGERRRIRPCLDILKMYGFHAKGEVPKLKKMLATYSDEVKWWDNESEKFKIPEVIQHIQGAEKEHELRSIGDR